MYAKFPSTVQHCVLAGTMKSKCKNFKGPSTCSARLMTGSGVKDLDIDFNGQNDLV